jgi:hypothetical protein
MTNHESYKKIVQRTVEENPLHIVHFITLAISVFSKSMLRPSLQREACHQK